MITLVLGGTRSGKSRVAESLLASSAHDVVYVATAAVADDDFAERVARHRARRPASWTTVESGPDLARAVRSCGDRPALVDSIGTWLVSVPDFAVDVESFVAALRARSAATVVVSEEAGLGVHPESAAGRRWCDALGEANQAVAAVADEVLLVVAGRVLRL